MQVAVFPARRRGRTWDRVAAVVMVAPSVAAIAVFVYGFVGWTAFVSLTRWNDVLPNYAWAGWRNYLDLFGTFRFRIDIVNTLKFTLAFLAGCLAIGFTLAVLLDRGIRAEPLFRTIYLAPLAISFIVTGVVWRWLLNPGSVQLGSVGVNLLLDRLHLGVLKTGWYTDPRIGILAVAIAATWQLSGYTMALYLAGLRGIPDEIREAARVDGASEGQIYRRILIPLLQPITLSAVIILGHISLKIFDLVVSMTGPGPGFSSDVPAFFMFDTTFRGNHFAQGAAIAEILLVLVALLTVPYLIYSTRTEVER
jgi:glucose/mannose transport system permease protein